MKSMKLRIGVVVFSAIAALAAGLAMAAPASGIRYCCTPQQANACAAQGGTASCRTGICQCLF